MALLYGILTPPFQAPDETLHFFKAYQVSTGRVVSVAAEGSLGGWLPTEIAAIADRHFPPQIDPPSAFRFDPAAVLAAWRHDSDLGPAVFVPFPNMAPYAPTMYLPQALGILLARKAGLPPIGLFYAGRLVNALAAITLVLAALSLMPFGRGALLAFAFMPTTLMQAGSLSADATIIGFGFLCLALALRGAAGGPVPPLGLRETWTTPLAFAALALAKGVYWPVAAAGIPSRQLGFGPRQWLLLGSAALGVACFLAWLVFGRGAEIQFSIVSRRTLEPALTARPVEQLAVILAAPLDYVRVLASSFAERLPVYILQVIGRPGWNVVLLPLPLYLMGMLLVGVAMLAPWGPATRPTRWQRAWWLAIVAGLVVLIETALYVSGTPLGADYIQGTQGRYFVPFLPLLPLALTWPLDPAGRAGQLANQILVALAVGLNLMVMAIALDAFWISGFTRGRGF